MSKQEEIKECLVELFEQTDFSKETPAQLADAVLWVENELDVAIKVEEELHIEIVGDITLAGAGLLTKEIKDLLPQLGYTAWEPLIKEVGNVQETT